MANLALRDRWPACVALTLVLVVAMATGRIAEEQARLRDRARFDAGVENARSALQERLRDCESKTRSMRGFFEASRSVGAAEWGVFAEATLGEGNHRAVKSLCFVEQVSRDNLEDYVQERRKAGDRGFTVRPEGDRASYLVILHSYPAGAAAGEIGLDLGADPEWKMAMERSRHSGMVEGRRGRIGAPPEEKNGDYRLFAAAYRKTDSDRTAKDSIHRLAGWVCMSLDSEGLVGDLCRQSAGQGIDISVFEGIRASEETLIHCGGDHPPTVLQSGRDPVFERYVDLRVGTSVFTLYASSLSTFRSGWSRAAGPLVSGGSVAIGMLLFVAVWSSSAARRALADARTINASLRESEGMYRLLFESSMDALFLLDGVFLACNEQACKILGCAPADIVGRPPEDLSPPTQPDGRASKDVVKEHIEAALAGTPQFFPWRHRRKNGAAVETETWLRALSMDGRTVLLAIVRDVTERKRVEEAVHRSLQTGADIMAATPSGVLIFEYDPPDRLLLIDGNPAARHMTGIEVDASLGKDFQELWQGPQSEAVHEAFLKVARTGEMLESEEIEYANGPISSVFRVRAFRMPGNRLGVAFDDLTSHRRAEAMAKEEAAKLGTMLANIQDGVVFVGADDTVIEANPSFVQFAGRIREQIVGRPLRELRLAAITEQVEAVLDGFRGQPAGAAAQIQQRIGDKQFVLRIQPIHDDGDYAGALLTVTNVTEMIRAREDLERYNRELSERARQLEEARLASLNMVDDLERARVAAEAASRAKSEFLANVSHEIRTPMNAIIGMTDLMLDGDITADDRESLLIVKESADSLLIVINDILDFSKVEAGRMELDRVGFDLRESLGDTVKAHALLAHKKGLEVICDIAPDVPAMLIGDPGRLRQVIVNLVGNAVKFTESGEICVQCERWDPTRTPSGVGPTPARKTEPAVGDGWITLHFSVTDTGIGIPREKQGMIFEAFAQVDGSTTRKYGGTGLGLAVSAKLVELMNGRIWVDSAPGKGSTFHFTAEFGAPGAAAAASDTTGLPALRDMPALVVDDNAANRRMLERTLRRWHMRPVLADSGRAALAALDRAKKAGKPFPLILLDAMMPEMDGFELARRIQRDTELAGAKIMMLSSGCQREDVVRCRELGITVYLTKPIKCSELLDAIMTALGAGGVRVAEAERSLADSPDRSREGMRILLAEDNPVNQRLAVRILEKYNHRVMVANNGQETIDILDRDGPEAFDLVLMDVQMPVMDGLEATRVIRARERTTARHVKIVAMTAHALKGDRERCLAAGMDDYVSKPIRAARLFESIAAVTTGSAPLAGRLLLEDGTATAARVIDWSEALHSVNGDRQLLRDIVEAFLDESPRLLATIRGAIEQSDGRTLQRAAHTLKGSTRYFGAAQAAEIALQLERMGARGQLAHARDSLVDVEREMARLTPLLVDYLRGRVILSS